MNGIFLLPGCDSQGSRRGGAWGIEHGARGMGLELGVYACGGEAGSRAKN